MAVREFDGTGDDIVRAIGALSGMEYGTIALLVKSTVGQMINLHDSGGSGDYTGVGPYADDSNDLGLYNSTTSVGFPGYNSNPDNWQLFVIRKDTGGVTPRITNFDYSAGGGWFSDDAGDSLADANAPGSGGDVRFSYQGGTFFQGRVAAAAAWSDSLPWSADASGDSQIQAAGLESAYRNWIDAGPDAAWRFNQPSTGISVVDDTGNGADQTSITGTTVITGDDPPGFDFSLDDGAAIGQVTETDTAQPIGAAKAKTLGHASETDTAQAVSLGSGISQVVGQAAEVDTALAITASGGAGLGTSYDIRIDWDNDADFDDPGENVTRRARTDIAIQYGRDQARALSPAQPGQATVELDNTSKDYTPGNAASPLFGDLEPGRRLWMRATVGGNTYGLYRGFLDGYQLRPGFDDRYVAFTALDTLGRFREDGISTELHQGIRTGTAINLILDAVGWPEADRDIDLGATLIPWWWEDRTDAFTALKKVVTSEGPTALATVNSDGGFIFRDRHHRLTRTASLNSQATFSGSGGGEPLIAEPFGYDLGWRDIINSITLSVGERAPAGVAEQVWSGDGIYSVADGETLTVRTQPSDPVLNAIVPAEGTDFRLRSGAVSVALSRTSGTAIAILITGVGGPAQLDELQLRAFPVSVRRTMQIEAEDTASIDRYGTRAPSIDAPWVNVHDALAIAEVTLAHRAERLPTIQARVKSGINDTDRMQQQLSRDLSDRVTVIADLPSVNDDFYIEQIQHLIAQAGTSHETTFGCEQVAAQIDSAFTFDVAGRGFDDGKFGRAGLSEPDNIFRFDVSGQGFDDGLLAY